jgi:SAM-dependent methyltransferase
MRFSQLAQVTLLAACGVLAESKSHTATFSFGGHTSEHQKSKSHASKSDDRNKQGPSNKTRAVTAVAPAAPVKPAPAPATSSELYSNIAKLDVGPQPISQNELEQGAKLYRAAWVASFDREQVEPAYFVRFAEHTRQFPERIAGASVLCIGARLGGEVRALTRLGALAVGIDLTPGFRNSHVLRGDASRLLFANSTFDMVYSNVLDHIPPSVLPTVFLEVRRVLKPGGFFMIDFAQGEYAANTLRTFRVDAPAIWTAASFRLVRERPFCRSMAALAAAEGSGDCVRGNPSGIPADTRGGRSDRTGGTAWVLQREGSPPAVDSTRVAAVALLLLVVVLAVVLVLVLCLRVRAEPSHNGAGVCDPETGRVEM